MKTLRHLFLLSLALLAGCDRRAPDDTRPADASAQDSAPPAELAAIQADTDELSRLRRLALWVENHTPEQIASAAMQSPPKHQGELIWLLQLKLADLNPDADDETLGRLTGELLYTDTTPHSGHTPDLREELLTLAKTSPQSALERIKTTRIHPNKRSEIANAILAQVAAESPERAFALLQTSPGDRRDGLIQIANAWNDQDPRAALEWARTLPPSASNHYLIQNMIESWSRKEPGAAVEYISSLPVTPDNRYLFSLVIGNWMRESPDESAKWIQTNQITDPVVIQAALLTLGDTHPALVARLLTGPLSKSERRRYGQRLASNWVNSDPAAARAWIDTLPPSPDTLDIIHSYASSLAHRNTDEAIAYYQSLPTDINTSSIAAAIGLRISPPSQALDWLLAQPDNQAIRGAVNDIIGRMPFAKPGDMLSMLGKIPSGPRQLSVYQATAERWFTEDPAGAARWVSELKDPDVLQAVITSSAAAWTASHPESLAALFATLPSSPFNDKELTRFIQNWRERDSAAASDWFIKNPTAPLSDGSITSLFRDVAKHAPDTLGAKLAALPAGKAYQSALRGAIRETVETSPQAAADLFTRYAGPKDRQTLIGSFTGVWAQSDPEAAIAWTSSLPADATRDHGLRQIIYTLGRSDPQRAFPLAALASSPKTKADLIANVIDAWHSKDSKAALTALETADLPAERRDKLREILLKR